MLHSRRSTMNAAVLVLGLLPTLSYGQVRYDEIVIFFNTWAYQDTETREWVVPVHGWIFEPERDSTARDALLEAISDAIELEETLTAEEERILRDRARWFVVDNERSKRVPVLLGDRRYHTGPSEVNGHFRAMLRLPVAGVPESGAPPAGGSRWIEIQAATPVWDGRRFTGQVQLLERTGLSVISDIDDTIKVTEVTDTQAMLTNTFLREFEAVEGMAVVYRKWQASGAAFHYVSDSPWQWYPDLTAFMKDAGFPEGTFALKSVRLKDASLLKLFEDPDESKPPHIESMLERFPDRRFILVGDSGQQDPEIYGRLARRHPRQIARVFIRNVTGESADSARFREAFKDIPRERWKLFEQAEELPAVDLADLMPRTQPESLNVE